MYHYFCNVISTTTLYYYIILLDYTILATRSPSKFDSLIVIYMFNLAVKQDFTQIKLEIGIRRLPLYYIV